MDAALRLLLSLPSTGTLVLAFPNGLCRVPVADAFITSIKQCIVGDVVCYDVRLDLLEGPVGKWVDFDQAGFVNLDDIEIPPLTSLAPPTTGEDRIHPKLTVCPLCRLNFRQPVIQLVVRLPQPFAMFLGKLIGIVEPSRFVDVDVDRRVSVLDAVNEIKRFIEVMKRVEEDEIDGLWPWNL